ncbi:MAG: hypothetical protein MRZ79_20295 [Bacteroidia bacterium]|nr:hypothetical protein [Bacteroidia bacterium]
MKTQFLLVEFVVLKDSNQISNYLLSRKEKFHSFKGSNQLTSKIEQNFAGGPMPYDFLVIDQFLTKEEAVAYDNEVLDLRSEYLHQRYAFIVRPNLKVPSIVKRLHILSPLFTLFLNSGKEKEVAGEAELANPAISPELESIGELKKHDQDSPFYMMNLNKFYKIAQYEDNEEITGPRAYGEYSKRIMPYLVSVKGFPSIYGKVIEELETDESTNLPDKWNNFAMVYYPSRKHFLRLMTNIPLKAVVHRNAGLKRAVLMPCSASNQSLKSET